MPRAPPGRPCTQEELNGAPSPTFIPSTTTPHLHHLTDNILSQILVEGDRVLFDVRRGGKTLMDITPMDLVMLVRSLNSVGVTTQYSTTYT